MSRAHISSAARCDSAARSARDAARLAAGEREDRHAVALRGVAQQDPADADLDVVGVRADREHDLLARRAPLARERDQRARLLEQRGRLERLGQVVVGAGAHRRDRVVEGAVAGQDQRGELRRAALDAPHELEAVDARAGRCR